MNFTILLVSPSTSVTTEQADVSTLQILWCSFSCHNLYKSHKCKLIIQHSSQSRITVSVRQKMPEHICWFNFTRWRLLGRERSLKRYHCRKCFSYFTSVWNEVISCIWFDFLLAPLAWEQMPFSWKIILTPRFASIFYLEGWCCDISHYDDDVMFSVLLYSWQCPFMFFL